MLHPGAFDHEILRVIPSHKILVAEKNDPFKLRRPWHQAVNYDRRDESLAQFWTRYILGRPHQGEPWNRNLSVLVNRVLDAVMEQEGKPVDHDSRRRYTRALFDETILRLLRLGRSHSHTRLRLSRITGVGRLVCSVALDPITTASFETQVLHAQLVLGHTDPCRRLLESGELGPAYLSNKRGNSSLSTPFGTPIYSVMRSGSTDLVRKVLQAPGGPEGELAHVWLATAVETRNPELVNLLMEWPHPSSHRLTRFQYELGAMRAIQLREPHLIRYLLSKATADEDLVYLVHESARTAAHYGDNETLAWALARAKERGLGKKPFDCCPTPLELACKAGRVETIRFLLGHGFDPRGKRFEPDTGAEADRMHWMFPRPISSEIRTLGQRWVWKSAGSMFWAATTGRVDIGEILVAAGIQLSEYEWGIAALGAVELGKVEFLRWMIDGGHLPRWQGTTAGNQDRYHRSGRPDLVGHVCVWGSPEMLRMLVTRGYTLDGPLCAEGHRYDNIVLAAMNWSRPDMVQALVDFGAPPADPFQSDTFKGFWETGDFPRRARTRRLMGKPVHLGDLGRLYGE